MNRYLKPTSGDLCYSDDRIGRWICSFLTSVCYSIHRPHFFHPAAYHAHSSPADASCVCFVSCSTLSPMFLFFPVWPPPLQLQNYLLRLTRVAFRLMISCESSFVEPRECNGVGTYCLVYWFEFLSILLQRQQRFYRRISCSLICLVCWCCNNWLISRATQCRLLSHSDLLPGLNVCVANSTWHLSPMLLTANDSSQF